MATTTNFGWETPDDTDLVKDGAAAIRTALGGVDTSFVDLKGGTTGQVLKKATNTDLDFVWSTDATGMTNPMTTTGDTIYSSSGSTPARLAIGSTGNVLTVAGGVPTWAAPAGGGLKSFTLLNSGGTALTGAATITVSGISNQQAIMVRVDVASSVDVNTRIYLRINGDTSSNYTRGGVQQAAASNTVTNQADYGIPFGNMSNNGASGVSGIATILGTASSSGIMAISSDGMGSASGGTGQQGFSIHGFYSASAAVTSISVFSESGNFDAGTVFVYGMAA